MPQGIFFQFFVQYGRNQSQPAPCDNRLIFARAGCSFINGTGSFRLPWALQMIPAILLVAGMVVLPESPRLAYLCPIPGNQSTDLRTLVQGGLVCLCRTLIS